MINGCGTKPNEKWRWMELFVSTIKSNKINKFRRKIHGFPAYCALPAWWDRFFLCCFSCIKRICRVVGARFGVSVFDLYVSILGFCVCFGVALKRFGGDNKVCIYRHMYQSIDSDLYLGYYNEQLGSLKYTVLCADFCQCGQIIRKRDFFVFFSFNRTSFFHRRQIVPCRNIFAAHLKLEIQIMYGGR